MHCSWLPCSDACGTMCSTGCISIVLQRLPSYSYLPLAETFPLCSGGGEGKHKRLCLLSHSLPPSPSHWRFGGLLCKTRCEIQALIFMHLDPFCVPGRVYPCTKRLCYCTICKTVRSWIILQLHCKEFSAPLTWWAKAGSWNLLTWISHSPCERTFFLLRTQGMPGLAVVQRNVLNMMYLYITVLYIMSLCYYNVVILCITFALYTGTLIRRMYGGKMLSIMNICFLLKIHILYKLIYEYIIIYIKIHKYI